MTRTPFVMSGMDGRVSGLDHGAAYRAAEALGYEVSVLAEILPVADAVLREAITEGEED